MSVAWPGDEFLCSCYAESVRAVRDEDGFVELAFWKYGAGPRLSIRHRMNAIWRIIRHGHPHNDQVLLKAEDAERLGAWLLNIKDA